MTLKVTSSFLYPIAVAVSVITTLLTPYLIRSADGLVGWFDRKAPQPLVNSLELYTRWVGQIGSRQTISLATHLTRRWILQMGLNAALIAAVFIAAAFVAQRPPQWLNNLGLGDQWLKAALWLVAVICSLPMFIATARKLQALGLLLAETKVSQAAAGERTAAIRSVVANVIPIAGTVGLGLFVLVLSSTLLPPLNVLLVMLVIIGLIAWLLWRSFIKVYSKAQFALQETFSQTPAPHHDTAQFARPSQLRDADLETVVITAGSTGFGKLIRELELRTRTGASIVAIDRGGVNTVNPGPDEELQTNDQVLLLGSATQLENARKQLLERAG